MKEKVSRLLYMLVAQFFLGMLLNVLGEPDSSTPLTIKLISYLVIIAHIIIAIGLIVTAFQLWRSNAAATPRVKKLNQWGLVSLVVAAAGGILTVSAPWGELWSYVMASGFMLAVIFFGKLLLTLSKSSPA